MRRQSEPIARHSGSSDEAARLHDLAERARLKAKGMKSPRYRAEMRRAAKDLDFLAEFTAREGRRAL